MFNGCSRDTFETWITVLPKPQVSFTFVDSICAGRVVSFTNLSINTNAQMWDFGTGDSSNVVNPTYSYAQAGTYLVSLTAYGDTTGCPATFTDSIHIMPNPVLNISPTATAGCPPLKVTFRNPGGDAYFHRWWSGTQVSVNDTATFTFTRPGRHTVWVEAEDSLGCSTLDSISIRVFDVVESDFTVAPLEQCGTPAPIVLTNLTADSLINFQWNFGDGNTSNDFEPAYMYQDTGLFTISLVTTNPLGCSDTSAQEVRVWPQPIAEIVAQPDKGCTPPVLEVNLSNASQHFTRSIWKFGDSPDSSFVTNPGIHPYFVNDTFYLVTLQVDYLGKCFDYDTVRIDVEPAPVADFDLLITGDTCRGEARIVTQNNSLNANHYFWDFGNQYFSFETNDSAHYNQAGTYAIMLIASNDTIGCKDTTIQLFHLRNPTDSSFVVTSMLTDSCPGLRVCFAANSVLATELCLEFW